MRTRIPLDIRIKRMSRVDPDSGCWLWTGREDHNGYGQICIRNGSGSGSTKLAHRTSYEVFVGPIEDGMDIDHLCRVRRCVNPGHLEPVTRRENLMRSPIAPAAVNARVTECPERHPYTEANTIYRRRSNGKGVYRACRTCYNARARAYRAARRAA